MATVLSPRLVRERRTVGAMIELWCRARRHAPEGAPCVACAELKSYADLRLEKCPYGAEKPTCVHCPIHCYRRSMRERMREVMREAGPWLLLRHPVLAIAHMIDGRRKAPPLPRHRPTAQAGTG